MWFMLNNRTQIYIYNNATMMNGIGQGSFTAEIASSVNIGTAEYDITKGEVSANIGNMPLNCLIFQNVIAKMNRTLDDA